MSEALHAAVEMLADAGVDDPAGDVARLLTHVSGRLHTDPASLPEDERAAFEAALDRRRQRQPVAQITGKRAFFNHDFLVTPDVLDPRPETEHLVEIALAAPFQRVLDLGTGSGAILLSLLAERPKASGLGTDLSDAALEVARRNAEATDTAARAEFILSDWFTNVSGRFDLIVSNPPYIRAADLEDLSPEVRDWEPHLALSPGPEGLEAYRVIAAGARAHLTPGGRLIVEIGWDQGPDVAALIQAAGFLSVATDKDYGGHDRVITAINPG